MYTIDMLIKRLEQIKKFRGGDAPVKLVNEQGYLKRSCSNYS